VYKCPHGSAPAYLTDELCQVADVEARQRLRSSSSSSLIVRRTWLPGTVGDWAFLVAAAHVWNILRDLVTSTPSVANFRSRLKTHLFNISYPFPLWLYSACAVTLVAFGHYNKSLLLACRDTVVTVMAVSGHNSVITRSWHCHDNDSVTSRAKTILVWHSRSSEMSSETFGYWLETVDRLVSGWIQQIVRKGVLQHWSLVRYITSSERGFWDASSQIG